MTSPRGYVSGQTSCSDFYFDDLCWHHYLGRVVERCEREEVLLPQHPNPPCALPPTEILKQKVTRSFLCTRDNQCSINQVYSPKKYLKISEVIEPLLQNKDSKKSPF